MNLRLLLASLALVGGVGVARADAVLFEENFTNATGKNRNIDVPDYLWASFFGKSGELTRAHTSISGAPGNPAEEGGYLAVSTGPGNIRALVKNVQPARDFSGAGITFRYGASHTSVSVRLIIRVSGQWYVSNQEFLPESPLDKDNAFFAASASSVEKRFRFTTDAIAWHALTINPGKELTVAPRTLAAPLPSANVSAIGFFIDNRHPRWGASACLDTLRVVRPARG